MRRKDREIGDPAEQREVLDRADSCRIGFAAGDEPYVVAMNFGYRWTDRLTLYFHCAREGRKLDFLSKNDRVCFQLDADRRIVPGEQACRWSMEYRSLAGTGRMVRVSDSGERIEGLNRILAHYGAGGRNESVSERIPPLRGTKQSDVFLLKARGLSSIIHKFNSLIPRSGPRGKRANSRCFFSTDRRFPAACGGELQYDADALEATVVLRLDVETISGKRKPGRLTA